MKFFQTGMSFRAAIVAIAFLMQVAATNAQELTPRESMLASKGNLKVSGLFKESPVLPIDVPGYEGYRIRVIPTFGNPISVRVEKRTNQYSLVGKRLRGQGGYSVGPLKAIKNRKLSAMEWKGLIQLLQGADFWNLAYLEKPAERNELGEVSICLDGAEWVLEGVREGKYRVVNRYCPDQKEFVDIGFRLLKLSKLGLKRRDLF
ncbi:MAG: hypothetical protein ABL959_04425 [Pyrinomonadaceae bacterium]